LPFQKGNKINVGKKASEETKLKMSKIRKEKGIGFQKGNIPHNKGVKGFKHSEESKEKIRQAHIGFKFSEETKQKFSEIAKKRTGKNNGMFGKKQSEKTKQKIREKAIGREVSKETKIKIGLAGIGKILSDETKLKMSLAQSGEKSHNWKGGKKKYRGYIAILEKEHPNGMGQGYVMEHRLVMEQFLGRFLTREEVVHHINGDKLDNRPENLTLFKNQSEHLKYHNQILKENKSA